ncbi:MAG: hypothetical protein ACI35W_04700 [Anaeroplasmataceae bacterium]
MKKSLYIRILILLIISLITLILSKSRIIKFSSIKNYASCNINIRKFSELYHYNLFNNTIDVSNNEGISVKQVVYYNDHIDVYPLNNKVLFPYSGLVMKVNKNSIILSALDDNEYLIYNLSSVKTNIYKYENSDTLLGYCNEYFSIKGNNLDLLNYNVSYEEI